MRDLPAVLTNGGIALRGTSCYFIHTLTPDVRLLRGHPKQVVVLCLKIL
jgi:hypothetical protein